MNSKLLWATMTALAVTWIAGPAAAQTKGGTAEPNVPYKASGTKEERAVVKQDTAAANKAGKTQGGEAKPDTPTKASGTKEEQAAARAARKEQTAADNKAGKGNKGGETSPKQ